MNRQADGRWKVDFDTSFCEPGPLYASIRATNPAAAEDIKLSIEGNIANPAP